MTEAQADSSSLQLHPPRKGWGMTLRRYRTYIAIGSAMGAVAMASPVLAQSTRPEVSTEDEAAQDIVVTGSLTKRAPASVSVSTVSQETLVQTVPVSAADLLRNVPGVFVNSALGEVRNVVYSRGISANSADAASGYYYVSLQEDGLPVTNVTLTNYSPDFFLRQDAGLGRLEALRGGTAVVTGPNAPGGIFNYISKTGKSDSGLELRGRFGLEGDGRNPFYRGDFVAGGQIRQGLYYSVSGFYRQSTGARDPGYAMNRGGQIKGNLLWNYGAGSLMLYGKYLDDRNAFNEFLPARNFSDPTLAPGISRYDSLLIPRAPHSYVETINDSRKNWDGSDLAHSTSAMAGLKWEHNFDNGWTVRNNFKYADNKVRYHTSALVFALPITDAFTNVFLNLNRPGIYTYTDNTTGQVLAQVQLAGGVRTVLSNNLPNQQVLANGIVTQVAFNYNPHVKEVMDQFSVSKTFQGGSATIGGFFANSDVNQYGGGAGMGLATLQHQPHMLGITLAPAGGGAVQQVTDPAGFTGIGQRFGGAPFSGSQRQVSLFGGFDYEVTAGLTLEGAVRYENIRNKGTNNVAVANPRGNDVTYGGLDGDTNTLFDNYAITYAPISYGFNLDFVSYSVAATYAFDRENSVYARFSRGEKAPDFGFYTTYDSALKIATLKPVTQKVAQFEAGFRHRGRTVRVAAIPFYTKLSDVPSLFAFGTRADGTTYVPTPLLSTTETYGLEVEADWDVLDVLNLRTALTLQDSRSKGFATYAFNGPGEADDTIVRIPDGQADNAAKFFSTTTLRYTPSEAFTTYATWRYMGKRAANRWNAFYLPAYNEVDIGATVKVLSNVSIGANVNNVFNSTGVLSFAPSGALLSALDRQSLTPTAIAANPNQLFNILQNPPRSFFLTATVKF